MSQIGTTPSGIPVYKLDPDDGPGYQRLTLRPPADSAVIVILPNARVAGIITLTEEDGLGAGLVVSGSAATEAEIMQDLGRFVGLVSGFDTYSVHWADLAYTAYLIRRGAAAGDVPIADLRFRLDRMSG